MFQYVRPNSPTVRLVSIKLCWWQLNNPEGWVTSFSIYLQKEEVIMHIYGLTAVAEKEGRIQLCGFAHRFAHFLD